MLNGSSADQGILAVTVLRYSCLVGYDVGFSYFFGLSVALGSFGVELVVGTLLISLKVCKRFRFLCQVFY